MKKNKIKSIVTGALFLSVVIGGTSSSMVSAHALGTMTTKAKIQVSQSKPMNDSDYVKLAESYVDKQFNDLGKNDFVQAEKDMNTALGYANKISDKIEKAKQVSYIIELQDILYNKCVLFYIDKFDKDLDNTNLAQAEKDINMASDYANKISDKIEKNKNNSSITERKDILYCLYSMSYIDKFDKHMDYTNLVQAEKDINMASDYANKISDKIEKNKRIYSITERKDILYGEYAKFYQDKCINDMMSKNINKAGNDEATSLAQAEKDINMSVSYANKISDKLERDKKVYYVTKNKDMLYSKYVIYYIDKYNKDMKAINLTQANKDISMATSYANKISDKVEKANKIGYITKNKNTVFTHTSEYHNKMYFK